LRFNGTFRSSTTKSDFFSSLLKHDAAKDRACRRGFCLRLQIDSVQLRNLYATCRDELVHSEVSSGFRPIVPGNNCDTGVVKQSDGLRDALEGGAKEVKRPKQAAR
jgi:hypothetical protein